jgi:hypothetical protein
MRELTADLFISLDGFASGTDEPAYFGYFGRELGAWVRDELDRPQAILMGRVTDAGPVRRRKHLSGRLSGGGT